MVREFAPFHFIKTYVTKRTDSLLKPDLERYHTVLSSILNGKKVLVIGGAGNNGPDYIKASLKFNISGLLVVVINGN